MHHDDFNAHKDLKSTPKPKTPQAWKQQETGWTIGELFLTAMLILAATGVWAAYGDEVMKWWDAYTQGAKATGSG